MCMACEQTLTVEQVLNLTANDLRRINVPVELCESIGVPVANAIRNLQACVNALEIAKAEQEAKEEPIADGEEVNDDEREADAE